MKHQRMTSRITLLMALLLCALLVSAIPAGVLAAEWLQFQNDAANSGSTVDAGPTAGVAQGWKQYTSAAQMNGIDTVPIVAGGTVFVLSIAGKVHSFDAQTGAPLWTRDLGSAATFTFELASPCYAEGNLYVAKQDGEVWALNGSTGDTVWGPVQLGATSDQLNTPVTYADGKIYIGSAYGNKTYYCLDAANGNLVWSVASTTGKGYYWAGACVIGDYLIFGDDDATLTCVNKDTGAVMDEEDLKTVEAGAGCIRSSVSYDEGAGQVYLTDQGGYCWAYAFNSTTGDLTYQWHTTIGWSTSTPTVHDGKVYVGQGGGYSGLGALHCLNEADGAVNWTFTTPNGGGVQSSPVLSIQGPETFIYFTSNCADGAAYCLDSSGNKLWQYTTDEAGNEAGHILQGLAVSDGWVYFGNDGGYLYALREPIPAWDVNGDGITNYLDMILIGNHYGQSGAPGWIPEDVNDDGTVNYLDMILIGNHYGE
jgi:outer membrane protein assembly factor BamB